MLSSLIMMHHFQIVSVFQESKENVLFCQIANVNPKSLFYPISHYFFLEKGDKFLSEPLNCVPHITRMGAFGLLLLYIMEGWYRIGNSRFSISGRPSPILLLRCSAKYASPSVCNVLPTYSRALQVSLHAYFPIFSSGTATLVSLHP